MRFAAGFRSFVAETVSAAPSLRPRNRRVGSGTKRNARPAVNRDGRETTRSKPLSQVGCTMPDTLMKSKSRVRCSSTDLGAKRNDHRELYPYQ
ncbi:hypothetical protein ABIF68_007130 [Bradyrhizobium japonicum]